MPLLPISLTSASGLAAASGTAANDARIRATAPNADGNRTKDRVIISSSPETVGLRSGEVRVLLDKHLSAPAVARDLPKYRGRAAKRIVFRRSSLPSTGGAGTFVCYASSTGCNTNP